MKRLTMRLSADDKDKSAAYVGQHKQYETGDVPCELNTAAVREVLCRLAEYEDTGLTPEQVAFLVSPDMQEMAQLMKECLEMIQGGADVQIFGLPAERVMELVEAEKEGRRGDTVQVVRCKNCRLEGMEECPMVHRDPMFGNLYAETKPDGFCSYGKRRGNEDGT